MTEIPDRTRPTETLVEVPRQGNQRLRGLGYNLRAVYRASWTGGGTATATGHRRVVRTLDSTPRDVSMVPPLPSIGFADGVQNQFLLRHEAHRPISLIWAAAGAVDGGAMLLEFGQRLELVGSAADAALLTELSDLGDGLPFHLLPDLTPWGVATATQHLLDGWRRELERAVIADVPIPQGKHLIVDGSIRQHARDGLVGVVKSVDTMYLGDESVIPDRAGWRSPVFGLPATSTEERDVVSAYLRLHHAPGSTTWSHGLIRLEARDPAVLDAACALALRHRQSPRSGDSRWAVHLKGMHLAEQVLKAMRHPALEF